MSSLPWFRLYHRIIDDEKIRLLAFEDRWHFIAILCMKADGIMDERDAEKRKRKMAVKMGLQIREIDEVIRRLNEVDLVTKRGQPVAWDNLQFVSDSSTERVRKYRQKQQGNGDETLQKRSSNALDTDTEEDTDTEKKEGQNRKRFVPPTVEQVAEYCKERNNGIDPEHFVDFYASKNWYIGKNKMKDWKATVRTWEKRQKENGKSTMEERLNDTSWV